MSNEQPDTNAMRIAAEAHSYDLFARNCVRLCDALDAARAEAAKACGAEVYDQLQDARRRIAKALAEYHADDFNADRAYAMFLALTEGANR